jgi:hypothetical protein
MQQQVDAGVKTMLSIAYNLLARQKRGFGLGRLPTLQEDNHEDEEEVRLVQLLPTYEDKKAGCEGYPSRSEVAG